MKKIILLLLLSVSSLSHIFAGDGDTYFSLSGGIMYKNTLSTEIAFEKYGTAHNSYEINLDYTNDFSNNSHFETFTIGAAYKKVLRRYKNANLRLRLGAGVGMNTDNFTAILTPGFEYNYTFKNRVQFFVVQKNQLIFWGRDWLHVGGMVGIKIPF